MGGVLDLLLVEDLVTVPTTVNSDYVTDPTDMTFKEDAFSIQVTYNNGASVNMNLFLEVSLDGITYSKINDSIQNITDDTGSHIWDLKDSGTTFMRVGVEVISGSIDLTYVSIHMRRRH